MKTLIALAGILALSASSPALAANANHPYANCDKKVDNCGPTGDDKTDQLNGSQLGGAPTTAAPSDAQGNVAPRQ